MTPRSFGGPMIDGAVHFRAPPILSSELRAWQKIYTNSEVFEETKAGKCFFLYIHDLVHARVHTPVFCRNLENRHLRLGAKRVHICLIVTIQTIVRLSKGTAEWLRIYSLGWVFGRLPGAFCHAIRKCLLANKKDFDTSKWTKWGDLSKESASKSFERFKLINGHSHLVINSNS